ncbi:MAG: putative bifunctional diguanylate cyclase/phosphodiesterase [Devosiaceae bacterium]
MSFYRGGGMAKAGKKTGEAYNQLHPLVEQQLNAATLQGELDVPRLLAAVSACYEASSALAEDVLGHAIRQPASSKASNVPVDVLEHLSDGILLTDSNSMVRVMNTAACALLGLNGDQPRYSSLGLPLAHCMQALEPGLDATDPEALIDFITSPGAHKDNVAFNARVCGGRNLGVNGYIQPDGSWLIVLSQAKDMNDHERLLHIVEQEYHSLFDNAVMGIYRSTLEGKQLRANPELVKLNGYSSEAEMLPQVHDISAEWYVDPKRRDAFKRELEQHGRVTDFVSEIYRHKTRERIWISENAWLVHAPDGTPLFYEGTVVDATDRVAAEQEINHLAHHDHLTGLPNRLMLLKKLREALLRPNTASGVAVHCLDLDHFKDVNDTLGHQAGDRLLVEAGKRLRSSIKSGDVLARFGGDEFTVLQYGVRTMNDVKALAGRIVETMNEPFFVNEARVNVGVSVGVATYGGQEPAGMLRDADVALYEAKKSGRETFVLYTSAMGHALKERRALEDDLRLAIETGAFELFLQPIVDSDTGQTLVYEALLRWDHPTRGKVSPARFVPLAEESSLMIGLGDWVLDKTVEAAAHLPAGQRIAMNLSPLQLRHCGFVERVAAALKRFDISPDRLELEITETVIMSDDQRTLNALNALRDMGLRLALDDFGTGHASLSYLQRFRFDKIKIDQSFVQRMVDDPISSAVVRAVTSLGLDLGASVVAEGVETQEQADALKREGCKLFQGYLFGRPTPWQKVLNVSS